MLVGVEMGGGHLDEGLWVIVNLVLHYDRITCLNKRRDLSLVER
jgi:hypothetical protein